jgi:dCMP deaminase
MISNTSVIKTHLRVAQEYAKLSKARRLKVACLIVKDNRILSIGINGTPSGYDNECEDCIYNCIGVCGHIDPGVLSTKPEVIHSEANAISFSAKNGIPINGCTMILTHSPCFECSKLIVQSGITEVYYGEQYRVTEAIEFLIKCNVKVIKIEEC